MSGSFCPPLPFAPIKLGLTLMQELPKLLKRTTPLQADLEGIYMFGNE